MRDMRRAIVVMGMLCVALLPMLAAVSPEAPSPTAPPPRMPVAIAQPIAAMADRGPRIPATATQAMLPESGMLVLVGTGLLGLAAVVRRTTR